MILRTALADLEVLGTRFTLAAGEGYTHLEVAEGRVKLTHRRSNRHEEALCFHCCKATGCKPRNSYKLRQVLAYWQFDNQENAVCLYIEETASHKARFAKGRVKLAHWRFDRHEK